MFKRYTCFGYSLLISATLSGMAGAASLPIVNIGAGAVSARAMFGDAPEVRKTYMEPVRAVKMAGNDDTSAKKVTPRAAKPAPIAMTTAAAADILTPNRPATDIWAKNDGRNTNAEPPLRMPRASEFAVLATDFDLPEESLDTQIEKMTQIHAAKKVASRNATAPAPKPAPIATETAGYADDIFGKNVTSEPVAVKTVERVIERVPDTSSAKELAELTQSFKRLEAQIAKMEASAPAAAAPVQKVVEVREIIREVPASAPARVAVAEPVQLMPTQSVTEPTITKRGDVTVNRVIVPLADEFATDYRVSDIKTVRNAAPAIEKKIAAKDEDTDFEYRGEMPLSKLSPAQLKKAFQKTYLSENKYLSTYQIDERFDVVSSVESVGFESARDLSEKGGIRPLEVKIGFRNEDSALSRDNYNLLTEYASIVVANPKRAIQVSIPERSTRSLDGRKLAARRLAIVEQVLKDTGVSDTRIVPVLSQRSDDAFVLRVISSDQFETLTSGQRDMFGDAINSTTYKSMKW